AASSLNAPATPWNATRGAAFTVMAESLLQRLDLAAERRQAHAHLVQLLADRAEAVELGAHEARVGADGTGELLARALQLLLELAGDALRQGLLELAHTRGQLALGLRALARDHQQAHAHEREAEQDPGDVERRRRDERQHGGGEAD